MDIVVKGRNVEVPDHYRHHVGDKLGRVQRYDQKLIRIDVELFHERNPRQSSACQRVEITCKSRGPVVRSEACAETFYAAFETALDKLENRLRRSADRRRVHHGLRTPTSLQVAAASNAAEVAANNGAPAEPIPRSDEDEDDDEENAPGLVVREKEHRAEPMALEQALFEMELVGHDFYLFTDVHTAQPSVVYRRRGYDYGVIRLVR